jgi:hypothetical protein
MTAQASYLSPNKPSAREQVHGPCAAAPKQSPPVSDDASTPPRSTPRVLPSSHPQHISLTLHSTASASIVIEAQTHSHTPQIPPFSDHCTPNTASAHLNEIYRTHVVVFRVLGALLACAGVSFTLWQALETRRR